MTRIRLHKYTLPIIYILCSRYILYGIQLTIIYAHANHPYDPVLYDKITGISYYLVVLYIMKL